MSDKGENNSERDRIRAQIDKGDLNILKMLEERVELTRKIKAAKKNQPFFRPGREADLMSRLISESVLSPSLIEGLWRQIIAFGLDSQKRMTVAVPGKEIKRVACFRFGDNACYLTRIGYRGVLNSVVAGKADVGVLPHWQKSTWLWRLAEMRKANKPIYITAITPFIKSDEMSQSAIVAGALPDASRNDITLSHDDVGIKEIRDSVKETRGYDASMPNLLGIIQQFSNPADTMSDTTGDTTGSDTTR